MTGPTMPSPVFPGAPQVKQIIQGVPQPKLVEKTTGKMFLLIRDDTAVNGKLHVAPIKHMTSMFSIKPEAFKERFEWYVEPKDRPVPVEAMTITEVTAAQELTADGVEKSTRRRGGRPKGSKDKQPRKKRTVAPKEE
jgi:hypothetical protein